MMAKCSLALINTANNRGLFPHIGWGLNFPRSDLLHDQSCFGWNHVHAFATGAPDVIEVLVGPRGKFCGDLFAVLDHQKPATSLVECQMKRLTVPLVVY